MGNLISTLRRKANKQPSKMSRNPAETTKISLDGGERTIHLVPMNVDEVRMQVKRIENIYRIRNIGAEIAIIQETHDAITTISNREGYSIYPGQSKTNPIMGEVQTYEHGTPMQKPTKTRKN